MVQQPPPPALVVSAPDGIAGSTVQVSISGLAPGEVAHLAHADRVAPGLCPPVAGGLCLDIAGGLVYLGTAVADDTGVATYAFTIPAVPFGDAIALQALAIRGIQGQDSLASTPHVLTPLDPAGDADGDGSVAADDCDDGNADVYPGAPERCDGLDNDCDPTTDEAGGILLAGRFSYPTVADALAAAAPNTTVELCDGSYEVGAVIIDRGVSLVGAGSDRTTLGQSVGTSIGFGGDGGSLIGVRLGTVSTISSAVSCGRSASAYLSDVVASNRTASANRALVETSCAMRIEDSRFSGTRNGPALRVRSGGVLNARDVEVSGSEYVDHAVLVEDTATLIGERLRIVRSAGTGLQLQSNASYTWHATLDCTDCDFGIGLDDNVLSDIRSVGRSTDNRWDLWDAETLTCTTDFASGTESCQ
jgi:hypothetical protein